MTVEVYKSTDASAPVLSGAAGALLTVLDAVLVNGYGAKAAAGWTKPFSGTNKAVYQSSGVNGRCYRFVDDASTSAYSSSRYAGVRGFGAMTDVDTGTDPFPTTTQHTNGLLLHKSDTASAAARPWIIVADGHTCYIFVDTANNISTTGWNLFTFGKVFSYKAADAWHDFICGSGATNALYWTGGGNAAGALMGYKLANTAMFCYLSRSYSQAGTSAKSSLFVDLSKTGLNNVSGIGTNGMPYPNPVDGGLYTSKLFIHEDSTNLPLRGNLRGLYAPLHNRPLASGDTYSGVGSMAGKTFLALKISSSAATSSIFDAQIHVEISDTWELSS